MVSKDYVYKPAVAEDASFHSQSTLSSPPASQRVLDTHGNGQVTTIPLFPANFLSKSNLALQSQVAHASRDGHRVRFYIRHTLPPMGQTSIWQGT